MISFLQGTVEMTTLDSIVINVNNVGYQVGFVNATDLTIGQTIKVYTYLQVREDALMLFGFLKQSDLNLFLRLISVKGIGPKVALSLFQKSSGDQLINAIENGDVSYLKSLPGIGAKTASQIVLDLKGKLVQTNPESTNVALTEALSGLANFGYSKSELAALEKELSKEKDLSVDQYIKKGLIALSKK